MDIGGWQKNNATHCNFSQNSISAGAEATLPKASLAKTNTHQYLMRINERATRSFKIKGKRVK
jgi:hypothetical protein